MRESVSPRELNHFSQRRSVSITANLAADYSLGQALDFLDAWMPDYPREGLMHCHLSWHVALTALGREQAKQA